MTANKDGYSSHLLQSRILKNVLEPDLPPYLVDLSGVASGRIFAIFLSSAVSAVSCNRR